MSELIPVAKQSDLKEGGGLTVNVKGRLIALFLQDGQVYAIDDCCPHMGASLAGGYVENGIVSCPWHAWRFRVTDGAWADAPQSGTKVACYEVHVDGDQVSVKADW